MSRRALVLIVLALAAGTLTACSDAVTAPVRKSIAPSAEASYGAGGAKTCRGGWVSSEGRC